MQLTIQRIENHIVTCSLEDGSLLDIAQKWFPKNIQIGDIMEIDISKQIQENS